PRAPNGRGPGNELGNPRPGPGRPRGQPARRRGHSPPARIIRRASKGRGSRRTRAPGPVDRPRPRLLHRADLRDVPHRLPGDYQRLARALRATGIGVEVYPEPKKIGQQLQYAEKRGFRVALIAGSEEFATGVWKVKDLARREEVTAAEADVAATISKIIRMK